MPPNTLRRALAVALAFVVAACSATTPTAPAATLGPTPPSATAAPPTPTPIPKSAAEQYAAIRAQVEQIRGLQPTGDVAPVTIDETQLRANLGAEFDASNTAADIRNAEDELITLGLLPRGSSLKALTLDLEAGQVAGYYSPEKKQLFVVSRSGGLGGAELVTYAHEFTHQLQDQRLDLQGLALDVHDQADRSLARLALVEGDATSVQSTWMTENLSAQQLGQVMSAAMDPAALKALSDAPRYLRETALFPYNDGFAFVTGLIAQGGYAAVNAAFKDPPASTEQILHPAKYQQHEAPIVVHLPAKLASTLGPGWSIAAEDTLGEEVIKIWLEQVLSAPDAAAGAAGWGGDRLALLRGPNGAVSIGLRTEWDTPADAAEFLAAAVKTEAGLGLHASAQSVAGSTVVTIAIGDGSAVLAAALAK
ncbi:MAG TPA: hypothetical protein VE011_02225 [Candidatus Dormibacteraeota bacterium]|nr:hypothetical protein [Candidatus Dormibacteraeota bacterium]